MIFKDDKSLLISAFSLEGKPYTITIWILTITLLGLVFVSGFFAGQISADLLSIGDIIIFVIAVIHGVKRYNFKQVLLFIAITWIVSNVFESLSIHTGFPFGYYEYTSIIPGPSIFRVPVLIMPTYFGMGYFSYVVASVLIKSNGSKNGFRLFTIPFIGTFIMVMWDLVMDPIATNIHNAWIWKQQGTYFNIPLSNYFGWFFVVYVFLQLFMVINFYTHKNDGKKEFSDLFWVPAVAIIGIQGLSYFVQGIFLHPANEFYSSTALISLFTLCFVAILSFIIVIDGSKHNNHGR